MRRNDCRGAIISALWRPGLGRAAEAMFGLISRFEQHQSLHSSHRLPGEAAQIRKKDIVQPRVNRIFSRRPPPSRVEYKGRIPMTLVDPPKVEHLGVRRPPFVHSQS
jgi:hypothetical protein